MSELVREFPRAHLVTRQLGGSGPRPFELNHRPQGAGVALLVALLQRPRVPLTTRRGYVVRRKMLRSVAKARLKVCQRLPSGFWSLPRLNAPDAMRSPGSSQGRKR